MTTHHHLHPDHEHDGLDGDGLWECHELSLRHPDGSSTCLSSQPCDLPHELHHWTLACDDADWPCACQLDRALADRRASRTTLDAAGCSLAA